MGDAGEALVDAESRIQERMEELERERLEKRRREATDPEAIRAIESLRLARAELARQMDATVHTHRRAQLTQAIAEIERRMAEAQAKLS